MAEIQDERGNPIQLTDERGNPVELTDERGQPMHLKGVAVTTAEAETHPATEMEITAGTGAGEHGQQGLQHEEAISRSCSSSSSDDDHGQGVRRKKGIKEKIKEKLTGGKHEDEHSHATTVTSTATITTSSRPGTYEQHQEHEKKSMMEKIKEKLPGHHSST